MNGNIGERMGNRDSIMAPHGCYRCVGAEDAWVTVAVAGEKEWKAFCHILGNPQWVNKPEFSDELSRWKNQDQLDKYVEEWTLKHRPYEITEMLQKEGIMAGPSLSTKQLVEDRHMKEREFFVEGQHPVLGKVLVAGLPWKLNDCPEGNYSVSPLLGEHNDYIFGQLLGLTPEELNSCREEKVFL